VHASRFALSIMSMTSPIVFRGG